MNEDGGSVQCEYLPTDPPLQRESHYNNHATRESETKFKIDSVVQTRPMKVEYPSLKMLIL